MPSNCCCIANELQQYIKERNKLLQRKTKKTILFLLIRQNNTNISQAFNKFTISALE
jgi:hypothetical protein